MKLEDPRSGSCPRTRSGTKWITSGGSRVTSIEAGQTAEFALVIRYGTILVPMVTTAFPSLAPTAAIIPGCTATAS